MGKRTIIKIENYAKSPKKLKSCKNSKKIVFFSVGIVYNEK